MEVHFRVNQPEDDVRWYLDEQGETTSTSQMSYKPKTMEVSFISIEYVSTLSRLEWEDLKLRVDKAFADPRYAVQFFCGKSG